MNMNFKSWLAGTTMLMMTATGAFAEVVYNRGNSADPESLDPHKTSTTYEADILRDLFTGLVAQDAKAERHSGRRRELVDVGRWQGLYFQAARRRQLVGWRPGDGWMISCLPSSALSGPGDRRRIRLHALSGRRMPKTINQGKTKLEELGVKAIDDMTLEVTLNAPTPYFLEMLTHQATYPVNQAIVEKLGTDCTKPGNLVSNGAYTLAEFVPNDHIKLVKNPKFYDAANVKIDTVNYIPTEDRSTAMKRFEAGELDMQRRHADRTARRPQGQIRRPGAHRTLSRHLLLCIQDRQGAVGQS